jgi:hypothetical protein
MRIKRKRKEKKKRKAKWNRTSLAENRTRHALQYSDGPAKSAATTKNSEAKDAPGGRIDTKLME